MQVDGAILATAIGYLISITINILVIKKVLNYKSTMVKRRILLIVLLTIVMAICVIFVQKGLLWIIGPVDSKFTSFIVAILCVFVGVYVYAFISFKTGLAQKLLGERITRFA